MGITGLLPLLKPITKAVHIEKYEGKTIVIDGYSWIHKGIYGSALDLLEGKVTRKYIDYCLIRARFLLEKRIKIIFVFDGGHLPMKALEEEERRT
jgi:exonuclease 1